MDPSRKPVQKGKGEDQIMHNRLISRCDSPLNDVAKMSARYAITNAAKDEPSGAGSSEQSSKVGVEREGVETKDWAAVNKSGPEEKGDGGKK